MPTDPKRVQAVFLAAVECHDPADRAAVLDAECAGDTELRRRARKAGILTAVCCHSFRATGITNYLEHGGTLEKAQQMAAHESPKTTKLYDRTADAITLDEVERIAI